MGKKVTYSIEYKRFTQVPETVEQHFEKFNSLNKKGRKVEAAETAINVTEWLLDLIDESDESEEPEILQHFPKAIQYSTDAAKLLQESEDTELLPRAYNNICQCYLKMHLYELAVKFGLYTVNEFKKLNSEKNKSNIQSAYRLLGDIYFTKSLNTEESQYSDFIHAHEYYKKEREVIDTMVLADIPDPKEGDLEQLKQSSHFNMGVMESKVPALFRKSQENLQRAIKIARKFEDHDKEKTAWWELGNLYKRTQQYNNVKFCQQKELSIIKTFNLLDDYMYCYEEMMKFHLFLEEYDACHELYLDTLSNISSAYSKKCKNVYNMVKQVHSSWEEIRKMINAEDRTAPIATKFSEHIQLLSDYGLERIIIKRVDTELASLVDAGDYSNLVYIRLLLCKARALWELRESKKEVYLTACNDISEFIQVSLTHQMMDKLNLTKKVLKLLIKVHSYFGDAQARDDCKKLLSEIMKEENLEKQKLSHQASLNILEIPRITPTAKKDKSVTFYITILTTPEPFEVVLRYNKFPETVQLLMKDVSEKCWFHYGVQPILSHMQVAGHNVFPADTLAERVKNDKENAKAFVKGTVKKLPIQLYKNAASRLDLEISPAFLERLSRQTLMELNLTCLDIVPNQAQLIQQVLQHTCSLKILDLSANYLFNANLEFLLKDAYRSLTELNLSNNQLTAECIDIIIKFPNLMALDLSYNELGPTILQRLPYLLEQAPTIRSINLENTHLGSNFEVDADTKDAYTSYRMNNSVTTGLSLNLSNNHFQSDSLWHWTNMWENLERLTSLTLSNVSSDMSWDNFSSLSNLPKLSDLIFCYSSKSTLALCDFNEFFRLRHDLDLLDFTGCDLTSHDIETLAASMEQNLFKLKKLILNSNPKIGDEGIHALNSFVTQSKIESLHLSHCGLTSQCSIASWSYHLNELDLTENAIYDDDFISHLNKNTYTRIDDFKGILSENDRPERRGLAYQHKCELPDTPFD